MPALPLPCTLLFVFPFLQNKVFFLHVDQQQKKKVFKGIEAHTDHCLKSAEDEL